MDDEIKKLRELIKGQKVAMLTTVDADGSLHSRPMFTQEVEFDGDLWFFTDTNSGKVHAVERAHAVNVSYSDPHGDRYVSVSGQARLVRDPQKAEALWKPLYRAWFPDGLKDPHLGLLRISVDSAEYWDSKSSRMVQLVGLVKAALTGERYAQGDHGRIDLSAKSPH